MSYTMFSPNSLQIHGGCEGNRVGLCLNNDAYRLVISKQQRVITNTIIPANSSFSFNSSVVKTITVNTTETLYQGTWTQNVLSSACPGRRSVGAMTYIPSNPTVSLLYGGNYGDFAGPQGQVAILDQTVFIFSII